MRCVLVNDHDAGLGLGDDVVFMHLRAGGPKGEGGVLRGGLRFIRCGRFGKARRRLQRKGARQADARGAVHLVDAGLVGTLRFRAQRGQGCPRHSG